MLLSIVRTELRRGTKISSTFLASALISVPFSPMGTKIVSWVLTNESAILSRFSSWRVRFSSPAAEKFVGSLPLAVLVHKTELDDILGLTCIDFTDVSSIGAHRLTQLSFNAFSVER